VSDGLPIKLPSNQTWLPLIPALTWIRFRHSQDLDTLGQIPIDLKHSDANLKEELQQAWRELADHGTVGAVTIRGKRDGEQFERELAMEDLRNCHYLSWSSMTDLGDGVGWATSRTDIVIRVERHPDTYDGAWDRMSGGEGYDYYDLVVSRAELISIYPVPKLSEQKLRSSHAAKEAALVWLMGELDRLRPKSKRRDDLLEEVQTRFKLSGRQAERLWAEATKTHSQWAEPGRPSKNAAG
jgi:hypothetical protein